MLGQLMRLLFAFDTRLSAMPDGTIWTDGAVDYGLWRRYLEVFDEVRVLGRVAEVATLPASARQLDGPRVSVCRLPWFSGPWQFLRQRARIEAAMRRELRPDDAVIIRAPTTIGMCLHAVARAAGRPYAVEVIGDPALMFSRGSVRSPIRPLLRWLLPRRLRHMCAGAGAALYVTRAYLQERYPPAPGVEPVGCSSIELREEAFVPAPRPEGAASRPFRTILVGSLAQYHKSPDVLMDALAENVSRGLDMTLTLVGGGQLQSALEHRARQAGLAERVRFTGQLPGGQAVRDALDTHDLFVLPSRVEGLPRALVEAMARGLPCIGSRVGGIPELLPEQDLVPPGDVAALARTMRAYYEDPARRAAASRRNLAAARDYHTETLWPRRRRFYESVRAITEGGQATRG
jgi:glycosyltransferase involved in cell wall biosynthesis